MPNLSNRARQIPASPIRKLVPFADAARKKGTHVYQLNIGQPDISTPRAFFDAITQADLAVLAYTHSEGIAPLRQGIVDYYKRIGHELGLDQVIVTTGASEALSFTFASCLNPGDEIIIPEPFYANYNSFAIFSNVKVVPITTQIEDGFTLPDIEAFEELITDKTKAILICNPGNPTGVLYPRKSLEKLIAIAKKHDLYLIADEVYREFVYDEHIHHSVLGITGAEENVIVIDSVSKRFSACGARIGCVVSRNKDVMQAILKLAQARLCPPTLGQIGATELYRLPANFFDPIVEEYVARRNILIKSLRQIEGVIVPEVNGAFYTMVRLPVDDAEQFCQWMLEEFTHEGATVMMAPGSGFYASQGLGKQEVRIAYVLKQSELVKAMACLAEGLKVYKRVIGSAQLMK